MLKKLINQITPYYNEYKNNVHDYTPVLLIELMWEIGELIKNYIKMNITAPHKLFRDIYGKSESNENIVQKSWITREFLGRSLRVRNIFNRKEQIKELLPNLSRINLFRETMPFFDNPKYKFEGEERENLLKLLNSNLPPKEILIKIKELQDNVIGKTNPRNQKDEELKSIIKIFIDFYNYIFEITQKDKFSIESELNENKINLGLVKLISNNTNALSQDGIKFYEFPKENIQENNVWYNYINIIIELTEKKNAVIRRRFRKIVSPLRIVSLADMLNSVIEEIKKISD